VTYRKIQQETAHQRLNGEMYTPSRSRLFNVIAAIQGLDSETRPVGHKELGALCGVCRETSIRGINELETDGQLIVIMNYGWRNGLWVRIENSYRIVKKCLLTLLEMLERKKARDRARAKMLAAVRVREKRKKDLSDNGSTLPTDSESIEADLIGWTPDEMQFMRSRHAC
jgi:hypothetical protein